MKGCFGAHKHQINTKPKKQKPYFFEPKIWGILRVVASTRGQLAHSTLHNRPRWHRPDKTMAYYTADTLMVLLSITAMDRQAAGKGVAFHHPTTP